MSRVSADLADMASFATIAEDSDLAGILPMAKACIRKAFRQPQPWAEIARLLAADSGHPQDTVIDGQARNGARTLEEILTSDAGLERAAADAQSRAYVRSLRSGNDAPEPRPGAALLLALLKAASDECARQSPKSSALQEWMARPHAEEYVRDEILSKGHWVDDYDLFVPDVAEGAWASRGCVGVEQTVDDLCKIAESCYGDALAKKSMISVSEKGEQSAKSPPGLTKESLASAVMLAVKGRRDAAIVAMRQELAYDPDLPDLAKELFLALFVRRWRIRRHEAVTAPDYSPECVAKDLARLRLDLLAFRQMLWQAKRAAYGLMTTSDLNGRILVNYYSRIGSIGKSYFLQRMFSPFIRARQCEAVDFRHVAGSRFSSSLFQVPVLLLEELDLGEGDDKDTSRIKMQITQAAIMGEDKGREATRKRTHATLVATANSPLSVILAQADASGNDAGIGRRFWEFELLATSQSRDDHAGCDLDTYDWVALWKSVDEQRPKAWVGTGSDMDRDTLLAWGKAQQEIVNSTWFDRHLEEFGMEAPEDGEAVAGVRVSKLDELVLRQLKAEHLVSHRMAEAGVRKLVQKWVGARSLETAKTPQGATVILCSLDKLEPELKKPGMLHSGLAEDSDGLMRACTAPEQARMGAR